MYATKTSSHGQQPDRHKKDWSAPTLTVTAINSAEGAISGPLCDKHGSLSAGSTCP